MPRTGTPLDTEFAFGGYKRNKLFEQNNSFQPLSEVYMYAEGRMFDRWIDNNSGSSRSNGKNEGDLIECPPYVIESLLRDELYVERDLSISNTVSTGIFEASGATSSVDDAYNNAIIRNATTEQKRYILDYVGSSKTFYLSGADGAMANGDKFILSNVNCDAKINIASFDDLGNTTNGKRKDWKFAKSIFRESTLVPILQGLLFESFCFLFKSYNQYKIVALDTATSGDTWSNPLKIDGRELVNGGLTSLDNVYSKYILNYNLDDAKQDYKLSYSVSPLGYTTGLTGGSTLQTTCQDVVTNYKIKREFIYNSDWIKDDATAGYFITKLVNWYSKQRLMVTWGGDVKTYLKYEIGDQVKLNYSNLIPNALNNSAYFMVMSKEIVIRKGAPYIIFTLIQMT